MPIAHQRTLGTLYTRADVEQLAETVRARTSIVPDVALIIGTGFAKFADEIEDAVRIPYRDLPGFPEQPGIPGHVGELLLGNLEGRKVACLRGKVALLDGVSAQLVALPVRLMYLLGCRSLLYTNTVGAIDPLMRPGQFVAITNHINYYGTSPMIGEPEREGEWGTRFFDMAYPYDGELTEVMKQVAAERGVTLHDGGVYFGTLGPQFETAAEIRFARTVGANVVGMTTIMGVIAARQLRMPVVCYGFISNLAAGVESTLVHNDDVLREAGPAYESWAKLARGLLPKMP
jgi:purine-nucleoside phosphorylase